MTKRSENLYLRDIVDSIQNIEKYTKNLSSKKFSNDRLVIDAVVRNLEIIGEAAKHVSKATKSAHPDVPWKEMTGMRNKVIHEYFGVDVDIVWETVENSLPTLGKSIQKLLKKNIRK